MKFNIFLFVLYFILSGCSSNSESGLYFDEKYFYQDEAKEDMALRKYLTAEHLYEQKNYEDAYEYYLYSARNGCVEAMYKLALLYKNGVGIKKDEQKWAFWIIRSAKKLGISQYELAGLYKLGRFVRYNVQRSVKNYKLATLNGHKMASLQLAYYYNINNKFNESYKWLCVYSMVNGRIKGDRYEEYDRLYLKLYKKVLPLNRKFLEKQAKSIVSKIKNNLYMTTETKLKLSFLKG